MSLLSLDIDDPDVREGIRGFVSAFLANNLGLIRTDNEINLKIKRNSTHIAVEWDGKVEASIPGPDPDLIRARMYASHAEVDLRISNLRVDYS